MKNKPIYYVDGETTVCLLLEGKEVVARGIAICSRADFFNPAEGRRRARNRALEARGRQRDCEEIKLGLVRSAWVDELSMSLARDRFGNYKGYYKPVLTPTEEWLVRSRICKSFKIKG